MQFSQNLLLFISHVSPPAVQFRYYKFSKKKKSPGLNFKTKALPLLL